MDRPVEDDALLASRDREALDPPEGRVLQVQAVTLVPCVDDGGPAAAYDDGLVRRGHGAGLLRNP